MPIRNGKLTRQGEIEHLRCLRQLQGEGVEVEMPDPSSESGNALDITISAGSDAQVFETPTGGIAYAIPVRLQAQRPGTLVDIEIATAWDDQIVLESPMTKGAFYFLGNQQFPMEELLNLRIEEGLKFRKPGDRVEGIILGTGIARIPQVYEDGDRCTCSLSLMEAEGGCFAQQVSLLVRRVRNAGSLAPVRNLESSQPTAPASPAKLSPSTNEKLPPLREPTS